MADEEIKDLGVEKSVLDGTEWIPGQQTDGTTFHAPASAFGDLPGGSSSVLTAGALITPGLWPGFVAHGTTALIPTGPSGAFDPSLQIALPTMPINGGAFICGVTLIAPEFSSGSLEARVIIYITNTLGTVACEADTGVVSVPLTSGAVHTMKDPDWAAGGFGVLNFEFGAGTEVSTDAGNGEFISTGDDLWNVAVNVQFGVTNLQP